MGSIITITNNGIIDIIKVIMSFENRGIFYLKEMLEKLVAKKENYLIFYVR